MFLSYYGYLLFNANPDGSVAAPNANVRSCQETETDPDNGGSRLERPTTRGDHDQESGLGLAWRPTGPGVCAVSSTPAPFSFGTVDPDAGVPVAAPVKCLATAIDSWRSRVTFFVDSGAGQCLCSVSGVCFSSMVVFADRGGFVEQLEPLCVCVRCAFCFGS